MNQGMQCLLTTVQYTFIAQECSLVSVQCTFIAKECSLAIVRRAHASTCGQVNISTQTKNSAIRKRISAFRSRIGSRLQQSKADFGIRKQTLAFESRLRHLETERSRNSRQLTLALTLAGRTFLMIPRSGMTPYLSLPTISIPHTARSLAESPSVASR